MYLNNESIRMKKIIKYILHKLMILKIYVSWVNEENILVGPNRVLIKFGLGFHEKNMDWAKKDIKISSNG